MGLAAGSALIKNGYFARLLLTITATIFMVIVTVLYIGRMGELNLMNGVVKKIPSLGTLLSIFIYFLGGLAVYFLLLPS